MNQVKNGKIIFLNQSTGPLFRELASDISKVWPGSVLYAATDGTTHDDLPAFQHISEAPPYDRRNYLTRLLSWCSYFIRALCFIWGNSRDSILFIVSNPPFLGLAGLFYKLIRGQRYVVLVYDIYPDLLIRLNKLHPGILSRGWDLLNRLVYSNASLVITIDNDMAERINKKFSGHGQNGKKVVCIPPWADVEHIRPVEKGQNPFAKMHNLSDKTVMLYSGNMGHTHDIETIIEAARILRNEDGIHFLFIGGGAKQALVERAKIDYGLNNLTCLPFQPEEVLPWSLPSGDVGIVTYERGTQGCMVPSKAFYYLAAGLPILVISEKETDLTRLVQKNDCGVRVKNKDMDNMVKTIKALFENRGLLIRCKKSARDVAVKYFSRKNTGLFIEELQKII